MWNTTLISKEKREGKLYIVVNFTDGIESYNKEFVSQSIGDDIIWLKRMIKNEIERLSTREELNNITSLEFTEPPAPEQTKMQKLQILMDKYSQRKALVDKNLFTADEVKLLEIRTQIRGLYDELKLNT